MIIFNLCIKRVNYIIGILISEILQQNFTNFPKHKQKKQTYYSFEFHWSPFGGRLPVALWIWGSPNHLKFLLLVIWGRILLWSSFNFIDTCSRQPEVLWAQRSDKVYLTVSLPDAKDVSVKCEPEGVFTFSAVGVNGEPFVATLRLFENINPQVSLLFLGGIFLFIQAWLFCGIYFKVFICGYWPLDCCIFLYDNEAELLECWRLVLTLSKGNMSRWHSMSDIVEVW